MSQVTNSQHVVCQKQRASGEDMSLPNECSLRVSLCSAAAVCLPPLLNKYCCQIIHLSAFSTSTFWQRACLCCDPKTRLRFQSLVTWRPSYKALVSAGLKIQPFTGWCCSHTNHLNLLLSQVSLCRNQIQDQGNVSSLQRHVKKNCSVTQSVNTKTRLSIKQIKSDV